MSGKITGLGSNFYIGGYDLSGDVTALTGVSTPLATLDVTAINKFAHERLAALADGTMTVATVYDVDTGKEHLTLSPMPRTDTIGTFMVGTGVGNAAASINAKEVSSDTTRANDGMLTRATALQANGYGLEWGRQMTAGVRTDTAATNGTSYATQAVGDPLMRSAAATGNYASTPDTAVLDITGDIDIRVKVAMDDWTPATDMCLLSKYNSTTNQRSYNMHVLNTTGFLNFQWSEDGTVQKTKSSTVGTGFVDGSVNWVRATLDVDNGAGDADIKFYTSPDGVTWTQLGTTLHNGATTSIFSGTADMELGARTGGTAANLTGNIFEAQVYNGIAGTLVAHPVATLSGITDATGLTWTLHGTNYMSTQTEFGLQAYLQVLAFTGTDVTVKLQHSWDNGVLDAYTDVTGGGFTQITSTTPQAQRIATGNLIVRRYTRVVTVTTGGFTNLQFAVMVNRNAVAVNF